MARSNRRCEMFLLIFIFIANSAGLPQMKSYEFGYEVKDSVSGNDFGHSQSSDGQIVSGQYHVLLPNGEKQTVTFTADAINGYQAEVEGEDSIQDYIIKESEFNFLTTAELRNFIGGATYKQSPRVTCSGKIHKKWMKCKSKCSDDTCKLKELENYISACDSGIKQDCIPPGPPSPPPTGAGYKNCEPCGIVNTITPNRDAEAESGAGGEADAGTERRFRQAVRTETTATPSSVATSPVIGTEVTPLRKYPWQVAIVLEVKPTFIMCGGTIINNRWILTSRNCKRQSGLLVRIGEHDLADNTTDTDPVNTKDYKIKRFVTEPNGAEIALIELEEEIVFNDVIRPVCLPLDDTETYAGYTATVSGWGRIDPTKDEYPNALVEAGVFIEAQSKCGEQHICTRPRDATDSCAGDSGGPLVVEENGRLTLVGIVGEGPEMCSIPSDASAKVDPSKQISFFIRVTKFMKWITESTTNGKCS